MVATLSKVYYVSAYVREERENAESQGQGTVLEGDVCKIAKRKGQEAAEIKDIYPATEDECCH